MSEDVPSPTRRVRGPSRLVVVATILALLMGGAAVAAMLLVGPLVRERITEEARKRGVEMVFADMSFWWWSASLEGVRFRLIGVPGLEGTVAQVDVTLADWEPRKIDANDVAISVVGSAADLALGVGEWTKNHPRAFAVPVSAHGIGVAWRPAATEPPWLGIEGGTLGHADSGATFTAKRAIVSGVDVGAVGASWTSQAAAVAMGFGTPDPKAPPVQLVVQHAATPPTATVTLTPTDLVRLTGPLGVPLPPGVKVGGRADLTFVRGLETGPVQGHLESRLEGWIPPHPRELDGFLFGNVTTFTSDLEVNADRSVMQLSRSQVLAGAFRLDGSGRIERHGGYGTIRMSLAGNLSCAAIAESATAAHLGTLFATFVGSATRRVVDGSVGVRVTIAADTRNLAAAELDRSIGVGCGLTPLRLLDPKLLDAIPREMQDLVRSLPSPGDFAAPPPKGPNPMFPRGLPSALPFPFPTLEAEPEKPLPKKKQPKKPQGDLSPSAPR